MKKLMKDGRKLQIRKTIVSKLTPKEMTVVAGGSLPTTTTDGTFLPISKNANCGTIATATTHGTA